MCPLILFDDKFLTHEKLPKNGAIGALRSLQKMSYRFPKTVEPTADVVRIIL